MRHPDQIKQYLKEDEFKVYKLIWQRFVASQMNAGGLRSDHRRYRCQAKAANLSGSALPDRC